MLADHLDADGLFELEHESGSDRLDDGRSPAFLPMFHAVVVAVLERVDVHDRPATRYGRHPVAAEFAPHDEDAGGPRSTDELVRRDEDRVLAGERVLGTSRIHLDVDVGRGCCEVPERQGAKAMEQIRDRAGVAHDSSDVRRRRERTDLQRAIGVLPQLLLELSQVDVAIRVLVNRDHVGDRLPPRELVRVMFERSDEDDRSLLGRDGRRESVLVVEIGRHPQPQDAGHLVDRCGRPGSAEDDRDVAVTADRLMDDPAGVFAQSCRLQAGARGLRVGVGVPRQDLVADEVLDECERACASGVVRVGHPTRTVRPPHHLVVADHRTADLREERIVTEVGCWREYPRG
jgi:hypothetical protein